MVKVSPSVFFPSLEERSYLIPPIYFKQSPYTGKTSLCVSLVSPPSVAALLAQGYRHVVSSFFHVQLFNSIVFCGKDSALNPVSTKGIGF